MTDTDLFTAGDSAPQVEAPAVTADRPAVSDSRPASEPQAGAGATGSLSTMVLPELRALASRVGVKGTSGMRKGDLIAAIKERQNGGNGTAPSSAGDSAPAPAEQASETRASAEPNGAEPNSAQPNGTEPRRRERRAATRGAGAASAEGAEQQKTSDSRSGQAERKAENRSSESKAENRSSESKAENRSENKAENRSENRDAPRQEKRDSGDQGRESADQGGRTQGGDGQSSGQQNRDDQNRDDDGDRQGRRGRRFRDRRRRGDRPAGETGGGGGGESELREDDVVQPVAGILDVLDNYAFVRTSGYLAGQNDVYVSMNMVRKNGLRRGDAVTGAVRVPKDGEQNNQRQKFNPLVRLDSVNGGPVEDARKRPEFGKLTPLYPNQRLRLETTPDKLTTRVIDLIMPIGKGQRALIVSPPKAGKTTIMQDIANAITRNNPECHLMVVLVDERPEEVTDMQRSVKGEVIASTFDRPPSDHTQAAELAIERAKRLVEQGKDVVVLLDSITRLGRAYNNASPASGRILSGGVDSTALYPPKRFLGAARNIEFGGSLTIIATAMVETGSTGDTVIFEEFKGTGNAELKLDRKIAERRVFPAVDVNPSGTRKDELLLSTDEFAVVHKLRRVLSGLDSHQAIDLLMSQLRKTKTNYEFLVQVSKTAPGGGMDAD
ncbi:transcription termination factor Rho [Mycolicibacterium sp. CH28]|uniref:transcription termination factor Rho n=1 Tax=Mycolicibacterium sp. CH28 TaxID=2512237 RepID=UPI001080FA05|nr:transcription termination factor Rho [Mycolicibacterium sp. CH28]TGD83889.1 transcription termination factor Rho [Mycolicibacterium sp. CH28]